MKKILLASVLLGISAFANDITGVIQAINNAKKTITVNGSVIAVMPYTNIDQDSCGIDWDIPKKFIDLKKGQIVEVDLTHGQNGLIAEDIEIKCVNNRAY